MENDRDTSLQSWKFLTLFLPRQHGREPRSVDATHLFVAPGRVNVRRGLDLPGEREDFHGVVAWGNGGDLSSTNLRGKRVVVLGHGSFALENMRHALESRARSVTLLARDDQLVLSKPVSYMIDRNADGLISIPSVLEPLNKAYALLGCDDAWLA